MFITIFYEPILGGKLLPPEVRYEVRRGGLLLLHLLDFCLFNQPLPHFLSTEKEVHALDRRKLSLLGFINPANGT